MNFDLIFSCIIIITAVLYSIMILTITAGALKKSKREPGGYAIKKYYSLGEAAAKMPGMLKVSVILPVRNEFTVISSCLGDFALQDYPRDCFEIIVSDDFSEDYTVEKVRKWANEHPELKLTILKTEQNTGEISGKKRAIERAVAIASGDILLTADADTRHGKSWIASMAGEFRKQGVKMVLGPVSFTGEKGMFQKMQVLEFLGLMGVTAGSANLGFSLMCNGANLAYSRQAFLDAGGFSGNTVFHSGDDQFLMMKFRKHFGGSSVVFLKEKEAIALTSPCATWNDFWEQRLRWVSKSRGYRDAFVIFSGALTFGLPLLIFIGGIAGIFNPLILLLSSFLWFVKILVEYPLVWLMAGFFEKKKLLNYYFAAQVFQFFYSLTVSVAGQFSMYSWKGRRFRK
ncbi:MAG: glycosyltransferase [Bacteroidetes bacterium]|nr:glycosyltransferase [Bacteroidota bacterium]